MLDAIVFRSSLPLNKSNTKRAPQLNMLPFLISLTVTLLLLPFTLSLTFQNLTYTHPSLKNPILTSLSGTIPPSSLTYIIGPSGSGKTSLINILTNRVTSGSITGSVFDDDNVAYVTQDDGLHAFLTVQETVDFWIDLLLPKLSKDDRIMKGDEFINKFNLDKSRKTLIGNAKIRGISGERNENGDYNSPSDGRGLV